MHPLRTELPSWGTKTHGIRVTLRWMYRQRSMERVAPPVQAICSSACGTRDPALTPHRTYRPLNVLPRTPTTLKYRGGSAATLRLSRNEPVKKRAHSNLNSLRLFFSPQLLLFSFKWHEGSAAYIPAAQNQSSRAHTSFLLQNRYADGSISLPDKEQTLA